MTRQQFVAVAVATFASLGFQTAAFVPHVAPHLPLSAETRPRSMFVKRQQHGRTTLEETSSLSTAVIAVLSTRPHSCTTPWDDGGCWKRNVMKRIRLMRLFGGEGGDDESNALLLRMDFEQTDVEELREWIRRYPFGTALPVQPFSLVETEAGVDVVFRKKPTLGRGSQDGGLRFVVEDSAFDEGVDLPACPTLTMRRITEGQEIRKMFAERIVVKAVVKALAGDGTPPAPNQTKIRTILHEGLV